MEDHPWLTVHSAASGLTKFSASSRATVAGFATSASAVAPKWSHPNTCKSHAKLNSRRTKVGRGHDRKHPIFAVRRDHLHTAGAAMTAYEIIMVWLALNVAFVIWRACRAYAKGAL
jgi:hypothetical protein